MRGYDVLYFAHFLTEYTFFVEKNSLLFIFFEQVHCFSLTIKSRIYDGTSL